MQISNLPIYTVLLTLSFTFPSRWTADSETVAGSVTNHDKMWRWVTGADNYRASRLVFKETASLRADPSVLSSASPSGAPLCVYNTSEQRGL